MVEYKRKLQIVAGSTYSLSLPKDWIQKMNLKAKQDLIISEQQDGNLIISPRELKRVDEKITISLEEYSQNLHKILVSLYFYGFSLIDIVSTKEITGEIRNKIRKYLSVLIGAEIIFEDKKSMSIKIVFDEDSSHIFQIIYRINLILGASIDNLFENFDLNEIDTNELEIDKLYNLAMKIVQSSLTDRSILMVSKINNLKIVPSLFLILKKLETIADDIQKVGGLINDKKFSVDSSSEILFLIKEEINKSALYLMGKQKRLFDKITLEERTKIKSEIEKLKNDSAKIYFQRILRGLGDIQDEVISIGFFNKVSS